MITLLGPQAIPRIDVFPRFLIAAVDNMVISDSIDQGKPVPWLNWITFWTELVMCGFIAGVAWYLAAGRPYCEQCHRWLGVTTTRLKVGSARQLVAALKADALETLPTLQALFAERPECYGQLEVSGCMHGREGEDAIIFATVSEITFRNKRWETQKLIDLAALSPDELTTIYDRCPSLQVEPCEVA